METLFFLFMLTENNENNILFNIWSLLFKGRSVTKYSVKDLSEVQRL